MQPLDYMRHVAEWVRRQEGEPVTFAHVAFDAIDRARSLSDYGTEPRLTTLRDGLRARALDKVRQDTVMLGLRDEDLVAADATLCAYEHGRKRVPYMQDRILRWLSDRPQLEVDDWTLGVWRRLLDETGLKPGHFDGSLEWSAIVAPPGESPEPVVNWSDALDALVGLDSVKCHVRELRGFLQLEMMRQEAGLPKNPFSLHQVFQGNPGTGKTSVARILAQIYREFGFLSKGHLIEVDRAGLVAGYVGQTEARTEKAVQEALGGVLFIDEAYSLASGGSEDFGGRAIDTLVKRMTDFSHDLVVIAAGYPDKMEEFIRSNPGLRSRFTSYVHFRDYNEDELMEILADIASKAGFDIEEMAWGEARHYLANLRRKRGDEFGNAREVHTLWEAILRRQGARLSQRLETGGDIGNGLTTLLHADVPSA